MQSEAPDASPESSSTHDHDASERSIKRQRLSARQTPEAGPSDDTAPPELPQQPLTVAPEEAGSSRDTTDMLHRSSTPPEASSSSALIKYTRTGRVSKATKGQRVHNCDECGKTYTRAEHLRRHQQNHKPGAFPCDVAGCGRSFHREDLLIRHKARHNDPLNPPSRRHSIGSQSSAPGAGGTAASSTPVHGILRPPTSELTDRRPATSDTEQQPHPSTLPRAPKRPIPPNELPWTILPIEVVGDNCQPCLTNPAPTTRPISPEDRGGEYDYESSDDMPSYYRLPPAVPRDPSTASLLYAPAQNCSQSPLSSGSSSTTAYIPQWGFSDAQYVGGAADYANGYSFNHRQSIAAFPYNSISDILAQQRDLMEQTTYHMPNGEFEQFSIDPSSDRGSSLNYAIHLHAYWTQIHESFPVIHQPTYNHERASPLLRTAILALGGQAVGNPTSVSNAGLLHEKCLKALKNRTIQNKHTYRVCDLQAIVLVEVYSTFKSRRPPLQFSECFKDVFSLLSNDPEATMSTARDTPTEAGSIAEDLSDSGLQKIDAQCKQRLLLACYLLEQQHNILFGRSASTCFGEIGFSLPFPSDQQQWDALVSHPVLQDESTFDRLAEATTATSYMTEPASQPYDFFRSLLVQARLCETMGDAQDFAESSERDTPIWLVTEQSPRSKLAYHAFMLCKATPVRDLLAVAGESWVMSKKLDNPAEFTAAQIEVRDWAMKGMSNATEGYGVSNTATKPAVQHALVHAMHILRIHQEQPQSGLIFQEWAVYLAAIVTWAKCYVVRSSHGEPGLPVPNLNEPAKTANQLDRAVRNIFRAEETASIGWAQSYDVLVWAKSKIKTHNIPHGCGLVSGALDVLGKLIERGNVDNWF